MVWLVFSGWLFRILLVSMWVLPLAAPLLLNTLSKAAVVDVSGALSSNLDAGMA